MSQPQAKHVVIVGAGLAGSLLACYLARDGYRVSVYERRPDPRRAGYSQGRSINLALSARGLSGLAGAGLDRIVMTNDAIPMRGRLIHPPQAAAPLAFQPYSKDPSDAIHSVSRGGLNITLLNAAESYEGVRIIFDHACVDVDLDTPAAILQTPSGETVNVKCDLLLGADGAFSPVRGRLQKTDRFEYSQTYLEHGYKELHIPSAPELGLDAQAHDGFAMDPNALHIWPRGGAMMIALPNRDKTFTCTLFWPFRGEHGFEHLRTPAEVNAFFGSHYPDAAPLMPTLAQDYLRSPASSLVTIRCWPWQHAGTVCLLGDAAHAIVPFYGQGMNAAFEDCRELASCLKRNPRDQPTALEEFQSSRKPNADAIADMAVENFVEMRDKVGSPAFRYRKRLEQAVHALFPDELTPQYNLVSFSTVPYAEARRRGRRLDAVLDALVARLPSSTAADMPDDACRTAVRDETAQILNDQGSQSLGSLSPAPAEPAERPSSPAPPFPSTPILFDITPPITRTLGVWPGDTPPTREVLCDLDRGDPITLSTLRATVHLGAHADGPNHYGRGAPDISRRRLDHYLGPCHLLDAPVGRGHRVRPTDIVGGLGSVRHPRVLIRTGAFPDPTSFNEDFAALSVELIDALAARAVITVGIDTPSVDLFSSKDLEAHHAILRHDLAILEGLALRDVPAGEYELIALPLPLVGFDASPVRAVLRRLPEPRA